MPLRRRLARSSAPRSSALLALAIALFAWVLPRVAHAWVDVHVAGDDVRVTLDPSGSARVEHKIRLHISGGPLMAFDLRGVDRDAVAEPDGYIVPAHDAASGSGSLENAVPLAIELLPLDKPREDAPPPVQVMRVRFDHARGISHGAYVLLLRYKTDLRGRGLAAIEGATARVRWTGPIFDDGFDSARVTFDLPSAPTEPRTEESTPPASDGEDAPTNPPMFLSTVRRGMERDEIELLRPYAPKAEAITWSIRADARALRPASADPSPHRAPAAPRTFDRFGAIEPTLLLSAAAALFAFYAALVAWKSREVTRSARAAFAEPRPLLPIPLALRSAGAGICLTVGVALELSLETSTAGAVVIALALAFAAHRTPRWVRPRRGPGRWLPVSEAEAFRDPPRPSGAFLDVSTRAGKALLMLGLAAIGAGAFFTWEISPYHAWLIGFDAVALLVVFCTGRLRELPPDPASASSPLLREIARLVRKQAGEHVRLVPRIRVPLASPDADELRLGVAPRAALQGLIAIEIGVVYVRGAGGPIALPEILVRVRAGSPCEREVEPLARHGRSLRGRHEGERVLAFAPRLPTARMTAAIAVALAAKATRRDVAIPRVAPPVAKKRAA